MKSIRNVARCVSLILVMGVASACEDPPPRAPWSFVELPLEGAPSRIAAIAFVPGTHQLLVLLLSGEVQHHLVDPEAMSTRLLGSFEVERAHDSARLASHERIAAVAVTWLVATQEREARARRQPACDREGIGRQIDHEAGHDETIAEVCCRCQLRAAHLL